jgi:L-aminopeptidase/D-esterase-like protein
MVDGDVIFALSLGKEQGDLITLGAIAAEVVAEAIVRAVTQAEGLYGVPGVKDLK